MDFDTFSKGAGNIIGRMAQQHQRDFEKYLRAKSDRELLSYLERADSGKGEYQYVLAEARRRRII